MGEAPPAGDGRRAINLPVRLRLDPPLLPSSVAMPHLVTAALGPSNTPSLLGSRPSAHSSWWEKTAALKFAIFAASLVEHWDGRFRKMLHI